MLKTVYTRVRGTNIKLEPFAICNDPSQKRTFAYYYVYNADSSKLVGQIYRVYKHQKTWDITFTAGYQPTDSYDYPTRNAAVAALIDKAREHNAEHARAQAEVRLVNAKMRADERLRQELSSETDSWRED